LESLVSHTGLMKSCLDLQEIAKEASDLIPWFSFQTAESVPWAPFTAIRMEVAHRYGCLVLCNRGSVKVIWWRPRTCLGNSNGIELVALARSTVSATHAVNQ
jgi:hypothetical protein